MYKNMVAAIAGLGLAFQIGSPTPAIAGGDAFVGGVIGGIVGGIIGSQIDKNHRSAPRGNRNRSPKPSTKARPQISAAMREENRQIQVALNGLSCDAGTPDGNFGPKTREAIKCMQAKTNQPITGELTTNERAALLKYYADANTPSSPLTGQPLVAGTGGAAALMETLKNNSAPPAAPEPADVAVVTPPAVETPAVEVSGDVGDFCKAGGGGSAVKLPGVTAPKPVAYIDDVPVVGFCDLKAKLSADASKSISELGASLEDVSAQCETLSAALAKDTAQIMTGAPDAVIESASKTTSTMVSDLDAAVTSARLCAGVGYQVNNLAMVEAASLFGASVGDPSLIEVIGWHVSFGLDHDKNASAGAAWLREAAGQMAEVDASLLLMPDTDRKENLLAVADVLANGAGDKNAPKKAFVLQGLKN